MVSRLAAKFAFFPPSPATYQVKKRDDGRLVAVSSSMPIPLADDSSLDVLLIDTKRGNKIVAFYLRNPYARLTLLYSHGNAADLGQLYDLFVQLKVNLRVNLMGLVLRFFFFLIIHFYIFLGFQTVNLLESSVFSFLFIFTFFEYLNLTGFMSFSDSIFFLFTSSLDCGNGYCHGVYMYFLNSFLHFLGSGNG